MTIDGHQPSIDLSSHLSALARARQPSPLKQMIQYMAQPGMTSFAGGLPHPAYFAFDSLSVDAYPPHAELSIDAGQPRDMVKLSATRYGEPGSDLSVALQYGSAHGYAPLVKFVREWAQAVYTPATSDWEVLLHNGNTDAWAKIVRLLCDPGDWILVEEFTFPSSQGVWIPMGVKGARVKMDSLGMRSDDLRTVLSTWEETHPGVKRPHVMYVVPVGSNPTGTTMNAQRRQEIYALCAEFDVIIVEDDPYSALQFAEYTPGAEPKVPTAEEFKSSMVPSFLKFDYQGRVIRLESFSKTLAPGNRCGAFIAQPAFVERLIRSTEVETQSPSGWSAIIISSLLHQWGISGYLTWLARLKTEYEIRRNDMVDAVFASFDVKDAAASGVKDAEGLVAFAKGTNVPVFSFVPPSGGMFLWIKVYLSKSPVWSSYESKEDPERAFVDDLMEQLIADNVLLVPGYHYYPFIGADKLTTAAQGLPAGVGYFRLAYSMTVKEQMQAGIQRMADVFVKNWM
ncbi:hypothetical protein OIV83_002251 [Microbotryomycetes sp. JL201]|nr:hypothetical protein OIV83_002251 [Microbotryomycetes sp. JL201]